MALIYDREETKDTIVIRWTRVLPFYVASLVIMVVALLIVANSTISLVLILTPLVVQIFSTWQVRQEIIQAQNLGALTTTGSRFSITNPLTMTIDKRHMPD